MSSLIQIEKMSKSYEMGSIKNSALKDISISIDKSEFAAFAGTSGSGKTTLLNLIGGLDRPTTGQIIFEGTNLSALNQDELAHLRRRKMGFIFQTFNLLPVLSAQENVEYPLLRLGLSNKEIRQRSTESLARVGLEKVLHHRPNQMSGGQRQRVAIARSIVHRPDMILADEPTANLDKNTAIEIIQLMKKLNSEDKVTFIFSTHDPLIMDSAKRIIQISDGQIIQDKKK